MRPPPNCNSSQVLPLSRNGVASNAGSTGAASVRPSSATPAWSGPRHRSGLPSGHASLPSSNAMQAKPTRLPCALWHSRGSACSFGVGRIARPTMRPPLSMPSTAVGHPCSKILRRSPTPGIEPVCEGEKPLILLCISRRSNGTPGRSANGMGPRGTFGPLRAYC